MELTLDKAMELMDRHGSSLYLGHAGITERPSGLTVGRHIDLSRLRMNRGRT